MSISTRLMWHTTQKDIQVILVHVDFFLYFKQTTRRIFTIYFMWKKRYAYLSTVTIGKIKQMAQDMKIQDKTH